MTVYVDQFGDSGWGKWNSGGHMLASDMDELHEMAKKIGLRRAWFQDKRIPHYDLPKGKRQRALAAGAIPIPAAELPADMLMRCEDGSYKSRKELLRVRHIESRPGVQGGEPVIADTRLPVKTVAARLSHGDSIEDLVADYPGVPLEAFAAARDHTPPKPLK